MDFPMLGKCENVKNKDIKKAQGMELNKEAQTRCFTDTELRLNIRSLCI